MKFVSVIRNVLIGSIVVYVLICFYIFYSQESYIFFPQKLPAEYRYDFPQEFEEVNLRCLDGENISSILFTVKDPKGVIFFLHGNSGSLASWDGFADMYLSMNYDVYMLDYRGFGKSSGTIESEAQLFEDVQIAYNYLESRYEEDQIIVMGYSIGTGPASMLAASNKPRMLVLQAPYYSIYDLVRRKKYMLPSFILRYKFETFRYLEKCEMPVFVFHGKNDDVICFESSLKLSKFFKEGDRLYLLENQGHYGIMRSEVYRKAINEILPK